MTPHPGAMTGLQRLQDIAERYLETPRVCLLCATWPATTAMIFVGDATGKSGLRRCAAFAVCVVCLATDPSDFERLVGAALRKARPQEMAPWN